MIISFSLMKTAKRLKAALAADRNALSPTPMAMATSVPATDLNIVFRPFDCLSCIRTSLESGQKTVTGASCPAIGYPELWKPHLGQPQCPGMYHCHDTTQLPPQHDLPDPAGLLVCLLHCPAAGGAGLLLWLLSIVPSSIEELGRADQGCVVFEQAQFHLK